jgi:transposase
MPESPPATDGPNIKDAELSRLRAENAEQARQIAQLLERIQTLEARLAKDSHNSSKPPSSDPPFKKPPPRSRRERSGRKPGGQKDHPGATRALVDDPEHTIVLPLAGRCACGRECAEITPEILPERRQIIDLVVRREVTEYRPVAGVCVCGQAHRSPFPEALSAPVQYGPALSALAVYLTHYQQLPYQRSAELLGALVGLTLSPATLVNLGREAGARLAAPVAAIAQAVVGSAVAHADETGLRVAGALHWLHVLCTPLLTCYAVHAKRGAEALLGIGLLSGFRGILVHDHWRAYLSTPAQHAFCNAHHLRELIAIAEIDPVLSWPKRLIALLCEANDVTIAARNAGLKALPRLMVEDLIARYDGILADAVCFHPPRRPPPASRRRVKQTPAYNLIARLRTHRDEVLRFITDLRVPFDNNLAERDLRMPKLKQKVSGCFRSSEGAEAFATVRSYLSTLRKQSVDLYQALVLTFHGHPPMPQLAT